MAIYGIIAEEDGTVETTTIINDPTVIVVKEHKKYNLHSRGTAKCTAPDIFDFSFGYDLACARAQERLNRKIVRKLLGMTK